MNVSPAPKAGAGAGPAIPPRTAVLVLAVLVLGAYALSMDGPFIFDDEPSIVDNHTIRSLVPPWGPFTDTPQGTTVSGRPLVNLSLALNYALGGLEPWSYHLFNTAIHFLAALVLFGIVRRTLARLRDVPPDASTGLALACAAVWAAHPLQSQAVVYVVQRSESLMGLFFLLTLYCAVRGWQAQKSARWHLAAVLACLAGVYCKEVIATAPALVLLYDYVFNRRSFIRALRDSPLLYLGLAACWALLFRLLLAGGTWESGPGDPLVSPLQYASAQPEIFFHYLRLALWPRPLVLDYAWTLPTARSAMLWCIPLAALAGTACVFTLKRRPWAYCLAWAMIILTPTSSVVPLKNMAFEHRMYLSLAGPACLAVLGGAALLRRRHAPPRLAPVLAVALVLCLAVATALRTRDYASAITIWTDTVQKRPQNERAYTNLGVARIKAGDPAAAFKDFQAALEINPVFQEAHAAKAGACFLLQDLACAEQNYREALRLDPGDANSLAGLAAVHFQQGLDEDARKEFQAALEINPRLHSAQHGLGLLALRRDDPGEARSHFQAAAQSKPDYPEAWLGLADADALLGDSESAAALYEKTLALAPDLPAAHTNYAKLLMEQNRFAEAARHFARALELDPTPGAHANFAAALIQLGHVAEALAVLQASLELQPDHVPSLLNLGVAHILANDLPAARRAFERVLALEPGNAAAREYLQRMDQQESEPEP